MEQYPPMFLPCLLTGVVPSLKKSRLEFSNPRRCSATEMRVCRGSSFSVSTCMAGISHVRTYVCMYLRHENKSNPTMQGAPPYKVFCDSAPSPAARKESLGLRTEQGGVVGCAMSSA